MVKHYSDGWQFQDCWQDGPKHYDCAIRHIEILEAKIKRLQELGKRAEDKLPTQWDELRKAIREELKNG